MVKKASSAILDRINKGCKLLDEKVPGWADKIDLAEFDIRSNIDCVMGQLGKGNAHSMCKKLGLKTDFFEEGDPAAHGFSFEYSQTDEAQKLWVEEIKKRQRTKEIVAPPKPKPKPKAKTKRKKK